MRSSPNQRTYRRATQIASSKHDFPSQRYGATLESPTTFRIPISCRELHDGLTTSQQPQRCEIKAQKGQINAPIDELRRPRALSTTPESTTNRNYDLHEVEDVITPPFGPKFHTVKDTAGTRGGSEQECSSHGKSYFEAHTEDSGDAETTSPLPQWNERCRDDLSQALGSTAGANGIH
jgi:hypothetical protein